MRVTATPYISGNPYQDLLAQELCKRGIQIQNVKTKIKFFFLSEILQRQAEIIHLHWIQKFYLGKTFITTIAKSMLYIFQLMFLHFSGVKTIWTIHNLTDHESRYKLIDDLMSAFTVRISDAIIVHCEYAKRAVMEKFTVDENDIHIVEHGAYIGYYPNRISKSRAREKLSIEKDKTVILFLGAMRPYKGVEQLMDAFLELEAENVLLVIAGRFAGPGEMINRLMGKSTLCQNLLMFPGFIKKEEIQIFMNCCDIVAAPFKDILTSGSVILAMSFARACIAPRIGCLEEILDQECSFLYRNEDENGLNDALNAAVKNRQKLAEMGRQSFLKASAMTWSEAARKTLAVYEKVLRHHSPV